MKREVHIRMRIFYTAILLLTFTFYHSAAQEYPVPRFTDSLRTVKVLETQPFVDRMFRQFAEEEHLPGLVYGVVLDGRLIYSGGTGYANLERKIPADSSSLFRIASMSKSFTAMAILQLRDAGKLSLDDPVSKYIPEMKGLVYPTGDSPEITLRHLLTHGAGFPEDNPWGDRQLADTDEELLQMIREGVSFSHPPGVAYEYSNLGFALLGQVIQRVSRTDFRKYMQDNILKPLGMNSTIYAYENAQEEKLALGYDLQDGSYINIPLEHHGAFGAMGGLITSIEDFSKYVALHLSAWPPRNDPDHGPLKRSSLREMHHPWRVRGIGDGFRYEGENCPVVTAYCYGLRWMQDCNGRRFIGHSGGLPGFGSNWTMMPEYGLTVMSFDNLTYEGTSDLNVAVLDTIIRLAALHPRTLPPSEILKQRKSELEGLLPDWEGAEESGIFAENFFMDNRLEDLRQHARELFEEAGGITDSGQVHPYNWLRGTFILEGVNKNIIILFTLTPEKEPKIQQVIMQLTEK